MSKEPRVTPGVTDVLLCFLAFLLVLLRVCVPVYILKNTQFCHEKLSGKYSTTGQGKATRACWMEALREDKQSLAVIWPISLRAHGTGYLVPCKKVPPNIGARDSRKHVLSHGF